MDPESLLTRSGPGSSEFRFELLSDGVAVVMTGDTWASFSEPWTKVGHKAGLVNDPVVVDTLRVRFNQTAAGATASVRGIHDGDGLRIRFVVGGIEPEGPHTVLDLGTWDSVMLEDDDATPWSERVLDEPIPGQDVRVIASAFGNTMGFSQTDISASLQAEVVFDNGMVLAMDDWTSPATGDPPPPEDHIFSIRWFLAIDAETAALIEDAHATKIRWRFVSQGVGWVNFNFPSPIECGFIRNYDVCPGDTDCSGAVDFDDLLMVLAKWGPCPGCLADLDESGDVGSSDLLAVLANWGPCA